MAPDVRPEPAAGVLRRLPPTTLIAVITFIGGIGAGLVFPILPALGLELGIPGFLIGLILSANRIARLGFNLVAGRVFSRFGARLVMTGALSVETLGMLIFSVAQSTGHPAVWLFAGRFVYGIGMAFLLVGAQAAVLGGSERGNRGRRTAGVRIALTSAVPCGLVLGGVVADLSSDTAAFLTAAAISAVGALLTVGLIPSLRPPAPGTDKAAGEPFGYRALLRSEGRTALIAAWVFNFYVFLTVQGALLATLVLLVQARGVSLFGMDAQGTSSLVMAVMIAASALSATAAGRLIDRMPLRATPLIPSLIGLALGFVLIALSQGLPLLLLASAIIGVFSNSITVPMLALLGDAAGERQHGPAAAIFQWSGDVGGTIGPMAGIELALHLGFGPLYLGLAALSLLVVFAALWLRRYEIAQAARASAPPPAG